MVGFKARIPQETINKLKRLANHFGYSLAVAMSGEPDELSSQFQINEHFSQAIVFDGLAKIQITKLEPLSEVKNEKAK